MNTYINTSNPTFEKAVCKQHDPNIWFDRETQAQAIKLCAQCPEKEVCLKYALTLPTDSLGIYAGLTPVKLGPMRRNNNNPKYINHGTPAGYLAHRRLNQEPCQQCRLAHNAAIAERRTKHRQKIKTKYAGNNDFVHGTASGYTNHYLHGTPPCDECKKAKAEYMRNRHNKK